MYIILIEYPTSMMTNYRDLNNAKYQVNFLLSQLNNLALSGDIQQLNQLETSSIIESIVSNKNNDAKREEGILLLGRIISAQQYYIKLLENKK